MIKHLTCAILVALALYYVSTMPAYHADTAHQRTIALAVTAGAVIAAWTAIWAVVRSLRSRKQPAQQRSTWTPR